MTAPYDAFLKSLNESDTEADRMRKLLRHYKLRGFTRVRKREDVGDDELEEAGEGEGDDVGGDVGGPDTRHHVERLADLVLQASDGSIGRPQVLHWLLHSARGQQLVVRLRGTQKRKESPMTRSAELSAIAKSEDGLATICKHVIDRGSTSITEHELSAVIGEVARREHPGATAAGAFAKLYNEDSDRGVLLRRAVQVAKGFNSAGPTRAAVAGGSAYDALQAKAAEARKADPKLTQAQAFAKVYEDPSNVEIVKRERADNRPRAA
jgi:hypothetical protein